MQKTYNVQIIDGELCYVTTYTYQFKKQSKDSKELVQAIKSLNESDELANQFKDVKNMLKNHYNTVPNEIVISIKEPANCFQRRVAVDNNIYDEDLEMISYLINYYQELSEDNFSTQQKMNTNLLKDLYQSVIDKIHRDKMYKSLIDITLNGDIPTGDINQKTTLDNNC